MDEDEQVEEHTENSGNRTIITDEQTIERVKAILGIDEIRALDYDGITKKLNGSKSANTEVANRKANKVKFLMILKDYPDMFNRSQTPKMRMAKAKCLKEIQERYTKELGFVVTEMQILKKINNMKSRVKKKLNLLKLGEGVTSLEEWEVLLLSILGDDSPVVVAVEGGATSLPSPQKVPDRVQSTIESAPTCAGTSKENRDFPHIIEFEEELNGITEPEIILNPSKQKLLRRRFKEETDETKYLSTQELKRLVLLKKLRVLKLKEKKLLQELGEDSGEETYY